MANSSSSSSSSESSSSSGVIESPFALLEACEAAIIAVLNGAQSYVLGDRRVTRADLSELMQMRKDLKREVNQLQGNNRPVSYADLRL
jgi:hypothetical protein